MAIERERTADALFEDAEGLLREAVRLLEAGDVRDAAEKAWGATVAGANGLLVARTGEKPLTTRGTRIALDEERVKDDRLDRLVGLYLARQASLHGECFYDGVCSPRAAIDRRIRETADLLAEARRLAQTP